MYFFRNKKEISTSFFQRNRGLIYEGKSIFLFPVMSGYVKMTSTSLNHVFSLYLGKIQWLKKICENFFKTGPRYAEGSIQWLKNKTILFGGDTRKWHKFWIRNWFKKLLDSINQYLLHVKFFNSYLFTIFFSNS